MKLVSIFALVAGTMVVTTEAIKLKGYDIAAASNDMFTPEKFVAGVFQIADSDGDGNLTKKEFRGLLKGMRATFDAADILDGATDNEIT